MSVSGSALAAIPLELSLPRAGKMLSFRMQIISNDDLPVAVKAWQSASQEEHRLNELKSEAKSSKIVMPQVPVKTANL